MPSYGNSDLIFWRLSGCLQNDIVTPCRHIIMLFDLVCCTNLTKKLHIVNRSKYLTVSICRSPDNWFIGLYFASFVNVFLLISSATGNWLDEFGSILSTSVQTNDHAHMSGSKLLRPVQSIWRHNAVIWNNIKIWPEWYRQWDER